MHVMLGARSFLRVDLSADVPSQMRASSFGAGAAPRRTQPVTAEALSQRLNDVFERRRKEYDAPTVPAKSRGGNSAFRCTIANIRPVGISTALVATAQPSGDVKLARSAYQDLERRASWAEQERAAAVESAQIAREAIAELRRVSQLVRSSPSEPSSQRAHGAPLMHPLYESRPRRTSAVSAPSSQSSSSSVALQMVRTELKKRHSDRNGSAVPRTEFVRILKDIYKALRAEIAEI